MQIGPLSYIYSKINYTWIKEINIRAETMKLLEENTGINLHDLDLGNDLLDTNNICNQTNNR